ncbi:MAG: 3-deoxy-D-manno-octulosonic acid transferase, partial [Deltaproteobacteria bacterium]|nr:3-deoxy-D-manno-octulosonic acid transferase [Deltaproteobacteria bacterium]
LEPAAWGKTVFYGPHMDDFKDAKALLEVAGAGITVLSPKDLAEKAIWYLSHRKDLKACGNRAGEAVKKNQGAAEKHARVITQLLA